MKNDLHLAGRLPSAIERYMARKDTMKKTTWNTYATSCYTFDAANDQRSAGGVHHHQVRHTADGWQKRIKQSNGVHTAYSDVSPLSDADGAAAFATAQQETGK